jgi:adenylyl cyclase-associated protein
VIKDFKDSDASHVSWAKAWVALLTELFEYVKKSHTTGVSWNAKGGDASGSFFLCVRPPRRHTTAAPAPAPVAAKAAPTAAADATVKSGLFSELANKVSVLNRLCIPSCSEG